MIRIHFGEKIKSAKINKLHEMFREMNLMP